ncbi:hypothetical protein Cadr_000003557 [Camelus dromedarius]|uniref:Uncharacterized protein n=1 Tax=Camelus dromedarius TaxID=9838 RepID=A0A5N4C1G4_CAMDR|nr:hypothetical protein Cadr_000003557 [Camelus dromedarius]
MRNTARPKKSPRIWQVPRPLWEWEKMILPAMSSCGVQEPTLKPAQMKALEFVAKINDMVPTAFPSWYEEAVTSSNQGSTTAMASGHSRAMARSSSPQ